MGIAIPFTTAYVYSVEIFPTPVRNVGIGSSSMCARIKGMIAPFMGDPLVRDSLIFKKKTLFYEVIVLFYF